MAILDKIRNRKISPDGTSTDRTEPQNGNSNTIVVCVDKKLKEPIEDNTGEVGAEMAGDEHVAEEGLGDGVEGGDEVEEVVEGAEVGRRKAVGDGGEAESGEAGEVGVDIGVVGEVAVGVVGVEESDADAGEGENLGQLQHGVDVALKGKGKDQNVRRKRSFHFHFHFHSVVFFLRIISIKICHKLRRG